MASPTLLPLLVKAPTSANLISLVIDVFLSLIALLIAFACTAVNAGVPVAPQSVLLLTLHFYGVPFCLFTMSWIVVSIGRNFYRSRRMESFSREVYDICVMVIFSAGPPCLVLFSWPTLLAADLPRQLHHPVGEFCLFAIFILSLARFNRRHWLSHLRKRGINVKNCLILGSNNRSRHVVRCLHERKSLGFRCLGYIDDRVDRGSSIPLLGSLEDFADITADSVVDLVIITLPVKSYYDRIDHLVDHCRLQGIPVLVVSDLFDFGMQATSTSYLDDVPMLSLPGGPHDLIGLRFKRFVDVVLSSVALLATSWLFALIALAIRSTSRGPIFYFQERLGLNQRRFRVIKFRTMVVGAHQRLAGLQNQNERTGPVFKMRQDPRVTFVGRVLRRFSLDELPQLFNVLVGDMSLVGPRPLPNKPSDFDLTQKRRHSMKPGLTCSWQIADNRDALSFEEWMRLDLRYIDEWSFWNDARIMARTVPRMLMGSNC